MRGMSRTTGTLLDADAHLKQSIQDILMTLIGTRLCRRRYGSLVPALIDQPMNQKTRLQIISSVATSLIVFEPRIRVRQVQLSQVDNSHWQLLIDFSRTDQDIDTQIYVPLGVAA